MGDLCYNMTQEWASQLLALGYSASMPLSYDRVSGAVDYTLGQLAGQAPGTSHETFHFVLNNTSIKDNRIPPYGFNREEARKRNALPVPADQYGNPGANGVYNYWDQIDLNPPIDADYATIQLLYQPTSWEYVQFLYRANTGQNAFLANEGTNLLQAWRANGMAEPYVMATAVWGNPLAVTLAEFSAAQDGDAVVVAWETASELNNHGFNLWRAGSAGGERTLLAFVPSQAPGSSQGASYRYEDTDVQPGQTVWYWLEAVDMSGQTTLHGPVSATFQTPTAVTLSEMGEASAGGVLLWPIALAGLAAVAVGLIGRQRRLEQQRR